MLHVMVFSPLLVTMVLFITDHNMYKFKLLTKTAKHNNNIIIIIIPID